MSGAAATRGVNRPLAWLTLCQGLFLVNNVTFMAINGLVGLALAPTHWMATLPLTAYVLGGAMCTGLVARSQQRWGRQRSFQLGLAVAMVSSALCATAALIATGWARQGRLRGQGLVTTVMSNLGLERHLAGQGLGMVRTKVGDRYVLEAMRGSGYNVGGEQSGHIILSDYATTGDGLVAALQVLAELVRARAPASEVLHRFDPLPQILKNVRFKGGKPIRNDTSYHDIVPNERIIFAYTMTIGEKRISASLATLQFKPAGAGTQLVFTEQGAFLDGLDSAGPREGGWKELLDALGRALKS